MKTTKSNAAILLNVSKPYLQKLLDEGAVTLDVEDLIAYKSRRNAERRRLSDERSEFLLEHGFYDERC